MKKLFFSILLLLIVGGTVFFFGYVPFYLNEGEYGVVHTKTNGWDHQVLRHGDFQWLWQALLPTNLTLHRIPLEEHQLHLDLSGILPSGETYAHYADGSENFGFRIEGILSYQLSAAELPRLFAASDVIEAGSDKNGQPELNLNNLYEELERKLNTLSLETTEALVEDGDFGLTSREFTDSLTARIEDTIPTLASVELEINAYRFPDMELYRQTRDMYLEFLERGHQISMAGLEQASSARAQELSRIEILREYGALLEEYPVLLEYYSSQGRDLTLIPLPNSQ